LAPVASAKVASPKPVFFPLLEDGYIDFFNAAAACLQSFLQSPHQAETEVHLFHQCLHLQIQVLHHHVTLIKNNFGCILQQLYYGLDHWNSLSD